MRERGAGAWRAGLAAVLLPGASDCRFGAGRGVGIGLVFGVSKLKILLVAKAGALVQFIGVCGSLCRRAVGGPLGSRLVGVGIGLVRACSARLWKWAGVSWSGVN
ncbi:MAG: hypothetical protein MRJ68_18060 [Nitrospira sp.]|nr:hypothetical protein [Nitrospira sp.]